ncbi:MAG: hypothetical protein HWD92_07580 [Flavobacteriia bacterium]|nr:hypothetical protein [Flavobacteriia bacterium]
MSEHDQMEEFFRDRAENYDYPFNERDWEALEARLDREMPTRGGNFWGQVLAGILIISLPWWPWTQDQPTPLVKSTNSITTVTTPTILEENPSSTPLEATTETHASPDAMSSPIATSEVSTPLNQNEINTPRASENASGNTSNALSIGNAVQRSSFVPLEQERLGFAQHTVLSSPFRVPNYYTPSVKGDYTSSSTPSKSKLPSTSDEAVVEIPKERDWQVFRPYVALGMEYAGTQMNNSPQLGYRAGAGIQIQPLRQFSLSLGVNYANIGYTAYEREFYPDQEVYTSIVNAQYEHISWADGTCTMWEVPVVVRWHPTRWLNVGTGLRSYIIAREEYDLYVSSQYAPVQKSTVVYEENHSALWAHWTINAGFQIPLGSDYLEIQPFYQIPLRGLGTGNVEWHSAGVSLRYLF